MPSFTSSSPSPSPSSTLSFCCPVLFNTKPLMIRMLPPNGFPQRTKKTKRFGQNPCDSSARKPICDLRLFDRSQVFIGPSLTSCLGVLPRKTIFLFTNETRLQSQGPFVGPGLTDPCRTDAGVPKLEATETVSDWSKWTAC